jgi:hypothetical protein
MDARFSFDRFKLKDAVLHVEDAPSQLNHARIQLKLGRMQVCDAP